MNRDSFIFYRSFFDAISDLPETDRLQLYEAIISYSLEEKEPHLTGIYGTIWKLIKPQLQANNQRFKNGSKGGAPKGNTNAIKEKKQPKNNQKTTGKQANKNNNLNINENVNIPTENDFLIFAKTLEVYEPQLDFSLKAKYESWKESNWKDGNGKPIKNWKTKLKNTIPFLKPTNGHKKNTTYEPVNTLQR